MLETTLGECRALADLEGTAYCFVLKAVQQEREGALLEAAASLAASRRLLAESGAALEPVERSLADEAAAAIDAALSPTELELAAALGNELAEAEIQA
jgi:hypothetical protein